MTNENGERLTDLCDVNNLIIGGTVFEHRMIHKETWISLDGRTNNLIDHVLVSSSKWRHYSFEDVVVRRAADVGSYHHLLYTSKDQAPFEESPKERCQGTKKFNIGKLNSPDVRK